MLSKKAKNEEKIITDEEKIQAIWAKERVLAESSNLTRELYDKSRYGAVSGKQFQYSLNEALYLLERGKMAIFDSKKEMNFESFLKKAKKVETNFWIRYSVFRDLRNRGYIVKTALKFGADFRVYDRGVKPGEDHAKWVVFPVYETDSLTWYEYAAKNRVAHSTRKRLLLGIIDEEGSVTYYECKWVRP